MFFFVVVFEEIRKNILELSPNPPSLQMEANIYTAIFVIVVLRCLCFSSKTKHHARKGPYAICEQIRHRSASTSVQSDLLL